jgi:hypothetical protein
MDTGRQQRPAEADAQPLCCEEATSGSHRSGNSGRSGKAATAPRYISGSPAARWTVRQRGKPHHWITHPTTG